MGWYENQLLLYSNSGNGGSSIFHGAAIGEFSSANKIITSAGASNMPFAPGNCFSFSFVNLTTFGNPTEDVLGCNAPGTAGWRIIRNTSGINGFCFYIDGSNTLVTWNIPTVLGVNIVVANWQASNNHIFLSCNGSTPVDIGLANPGTTVNGTTSSFLGGLNGANLYLTSAEILDFALLNREATSLEMTTWSTIPLTTNRFLTNTSFTSDPSCIVDFNAYRDYNASGFITLGSSPVTFPVTGTPTFTNYSEKRIPTEDNFYFDSKISSAQSGFIVRNAYARLKITGINNKLIGYEGYDSFLAASQQGGAGCYSNGSYIGTNLGNLGNAEIADFILPSGSNKSVELWEGNQIYTSSSNNLQTGYFITHVRVPLNASISTYSTPPQKRFLLLGDSIMSGFYPTSPNQNSVTALLRTDFPTSGTGGVTCHCWGGNSLYLSGNTSGLRAILASLIASELDGTSLNSLWIELATNDYGNSYWTAANFGIAYADLLDKIHALSPSTQIYCQTPFPIVSPGSEGPNSNGEFLTAFRVQITAAAIARSTFCTSIDGTMIYANTIIYNSSTAPTGRYYTDGLHNVNNGTNDIKAFIKTTLNY